MKILDIFGFQVKCSSALNVGNARLGITVHRFLLLLLLLLLYAYKSVSCCTIIHKVGSFRDNCTNKFVCTSVFASSVFVFVDTDAHLADDLSLKPKPKSRGLLGSGEDILIRVGGWVGLEPSSTKSFLIFGCRVQLRWALVKQGLLG